MKIIISPAKKMRVDTDSLIWKNMPRFMPETEQICRRLKELNTEELKSLWKCNDSILRLNVERLHTMDLYNNLTPAILAYEGIQYQHMAPGVFSEGELNYIQEHLRILSGFYGILKPFDGITPYRLEMQAKLSVAESKDLYSFWGSKLAMSLIEDSNTIVNLASKEYSSTICRYLPSGIIFITCTFAEESGGKLLEKGTVCKMARGEMVRFMAENQLLNPEHLKEFDRMNFRYSAKHSINNHLIFIRSQ